MVIDDFLQSIVQLLFITVFMSRPTAVPWPSYENLSRKSAS